MKYKILIIGGLIVAAFVLGRFSGPKSTNSVTTNSHQSQERDTTDKQQDVVVTTKETKLPDGTTIKETRNEKKTNTQEKHETETKEASLSVVKTDSRPSYRLGVEYEPYLVGIQGVSYSVTLERRLFSELYLGLSISPTRRAAGVTLSIGF